MYIIFFLLLKKNPGTVRSPEEDRGTEEVEMDVSVDVAGAGILSPHIPHMCALASTSTYASDRDIKLWATQRRGRVLHLLRVTTEFVFFLLLFHVLSLLRKIFFLFSLSSSFLFHFQDG